MSTFILVLASATVGYVASVVTWPRLRQALVGIENEIDYLRAKARSIETRSRG